jgi:hypothetical protein
MGYKLKETYIWSLAVHLVILVSTQFRDPGLTGFLLQREIESIDNRGSI